MHNKRILGLDISDYSIEAVEAEKKDGVISVVNSDRILLEKGIVEGGRIKDGLKLQEKLKKVLANASSETTNFRDVVFAIPDSLLYTCFFDDLDRQQDLYKRIRDIADKTFPLSKDDLVLTHKQFSSSDGKKIFLAGAVKTGLAEWQLFLLEAGLKPLLFDIEILANYRGLFGHLPEKPLCLVDIGANTTNVGIFTHLGLAYNYQLQYGGNQISEQFAEAARCDFEKAEEYRIMENIASSSRLKERETLQKIFVRIVDEIKKNIEYFHKNYPTLGQVDKLILAGGVSETAGLKEFVRAQAPEYEVLTAREVAGNIGIDPVFCEALGAAKRLLSQEWENDLSLDNASLSQPSKVNIKKITGAFAKFKFKIPIKRILQAAAVIVLLLAAFFNFYNYFQKHKDRKGVSEKAPAISSEKDKGAKADVSSTSTAIANTSIASTSIVNIPVANTSSVSAIEKSAKTEAPVASGADASLSAPSNAAAKAAVAEKKLIRVKDIGTTLNVRSAPSKSSGVIGAFLPGDVIEFYEKKDGWYRIRFKDGSAWIMVEYVELVSE